MLSYWNREMYCPECGVKNREEVRFCTKCGTALKRLTREHRQQSQAFGEGVGTGRTDGSRCSTGNEITIRIGKPNGERECVPILCSDSERREFILCEEGIYTRYLTAGRFWRTVLWRTAPYNFYEWQSLALYRVDEKKRIVGLEVMGKGRLLKLRSRNQFKKLESTVRRYAAAESHPSKRARLAFRIGILAALVGILLLAQAGAARYYENLSNGMVGDHACDVCVDFRLSWPTRGWFEVTRDGQLAHEYCSGHFAIYALIHPVDAISALAHFGDEAFPFAILALGVWSSLFWLAVWISLPPWYKEKTLY